jgi:acetylornithine deacetylase/succinyl-diaminopimelate desuccinylase-like protein
VVSGHFDSWTVGQGAHDDACSCMAAWQSLVLLKEMGLRPRRTLRLVLFTNEENGIACGKAYHAARERSRRSARSRSTRSSRPTCSGRPSCWP